jgi:hypothetical protein
LQRSEQKGRHGLSCHSINLAQVGHFGIRKMGQKPDRQGRRTLAELNPDGWRRIIEEYDVAQFDKLRFRKLTACATKQ